MRKKRNQKGTQRVKINDKQVKKVLTKTLEDFAVSEISEVSLKNLLNSEGYTVVRFGPYSNSPEVERLLSKDERLSKMAEQSEAFTYQSGEDRCVFVSKSVSKDELLFLLARELGNVLMSENSNGILGLSATDKANANIFAYHITDIREHSIIYNFFKIHFVQALLGLLVAWSVVVVFFTMNISTSFKSNSDVLVLNGESVQTFAAVQDDISAEPVRSISADASGDISDDALDDVLGDVLGDVSADSFAGTEISAENELKEIIPDVSDDGVQAITAPNPSLGEATAERTIPDIAESVKEPESSVSVPQTGRVYYATKSGTKYHIAGCSYIKGKDNLKTLTEEDIKSGKYEPCSRCIG